MLQEKIQRQQVRFMAVGDMMFCCELGEKLRSSGDYDYPFAKIKDFLSQADFVYGNLETPITARRQPERFASPGLYYADPPIAMTLSRASLSAVSLANNHIYDYGAEAVELTGRLLNEAGIRYHGVGTDARTASSPLEVMVKDLKLGFLAYCNASTSIDSRHKYVTCPIKTEIIEKDVKELSKRVDYTIVTLHEGTCNYPSPQHRSWARTAVDCGARIVLSHHPHVIGAIEEYKGAVIAYGLGNFVAYFTDEKFRRTFILDCLLKPDGKIAFNAIPVWINDGFQPEIAQGERKERIATFIKELNEKLHTGQGDKEYWAQMRKSFLGLAWRDFKRSAQADGKAAVLRKIKKLRWHHLRLLFNSVFSKLHD